MHFAGKDQPGVDCRAMIKKDSFFCAGQAHFHFTNFFKEPVLCAKSCRLCGKNYSGIKELVMLTTKKITFIAFQNQATAATTMKVTAFTDIMGACATAPKLVRWTSCAGKAVAFATTRSQIEKRDDEDFSFLIFCSNKE